MPRSYPNCLPHYLLYDLVILYITGMRLKGIIYNIQFLTLRTIQAHQIKNKQIPGAPSLYRLELDSNFSDLLPGLFQCLRDLLFQYSRVMHGHCFRDLGGKVDKYQRTCATAADMADSKQGW